MQPHSVVEAIAFALTDDREGFIHRLKHSLAFDLKTARNTMRDDVHRIATERVRAMQVVLDIAQDQRLEAVYCAEKIFDLGLGHWIPALEAACDALGLSANAQSTLAQAAWYQPDGISDGLDDGRIEQ